MHRKLGKYLFSILLIFGICQTCQVLPTYAISSFPISVMKDEEVVTDGKGMDATDMDDSTPATSIWGSSETSGKTYATSVEGRKAVDPVIDLGTESSAAAQICSNANSLVGRTVLVYEASDQTLSFSSDEYNELSYEDKKEFMAYTLKAIKSSSLSVTAKSKMYNFVEKRDTSISKTVKILAEDYDANLTEANSWLQKHNVDSVVSLIIGIMCIAIFAFLSLSLAIDIAYLGIPFVEGLIDFLSGSKIGQKFHAHFISRDAMDAKKEAYGSHNGSNVLTIYIKKRFFTIFIVAAILISLVTGQLWTIIGNVMDYVQLVGNVFIRAMSGS